MTRILLLTTCILLTGLATVGCTNPDGSPMEWKDPMAETKAKYPTYPEWGWWDHPADEVALADTDKTTPGETDPIKGSTVKIPAERIEKKPATSPRTGEADTRPDMPTSRPDTPTPDSPRPRRDKPARAKMSEKIDQVAQQIQADHRQRVWEEVVALRDMEDLTPLQQKTLTDKAVRNLKQWYAPLPENPPSPLDAEWIDILVWDFMPQRNFEKARARWRNVAKSSGKHFPENMTRRELLNYIQHFLDPIAEEEE